jgi:AAT family amino acid transporter
MAPDREKWSDRGAGSQDGSNNPKDLVQTSSLYDHPPEAASKQNLARKLSARQVQMIAIGGTIGTGLFLGTGNSLAKGGPASMLISYAIVGCIVFITMLSLGEMAAYTPIAGSFCTFAGRYVDDAFGFALTWNYWFNDAVSTASDLVALQLLLKYWTDNFPGWALSLIFLFILLALNIITVRAYGEMEYWLSQRHHHESCSRSQC